MSKKTKPLPTFASVQEEQKFWEKSTTDSTEYVDWSKATRAVFPNLKPTTTAISLRLPDALLSHIKAQANRLDVPYQSLMKVWLAEKLAEVEKPLVGNRRL